MNGASRYGLLTGLVWSVVHFAAPQPAGDAALWLLIALQALVGAVMIWRRTRLPLWSAGEVVAAAFSVGMAWLLLGGDTVATVPLPWGVAMIVLAVTAAVLLILEPRVNRARWEAWRAHIRRSSALDILLGRHIPRIQ